jgi:hypothetical protein
LEFFKNDPGAKTWYAKKENALRYTVAAGVTALRHSPTRPDQRGWAMEVTISKVAALLLALAYIIAAGVSGQGLSFAGTVAVGLLIPLALIWFPDEIDSWSRLWWRGGFRGLRMLPSPPWMLAMMGWVLLVGIPLVVLLQVVRK